MRIPFRNICAFIYSCYLIYSGRLKRLLNKSENGEIILSVYFHNPSKKLFKKCIEWFIKKGFTFLSADELMQIISKKRTFPKSAVILTVDDGWKENNDHIFSVVKKYGIPITLFATTQPIETEGRFWWTIVADSKKDIIKNKKIEELKVVPNEVRLEKVNKAIKSCLYERDALTTQELMYISTIKNVIIGSHTVTHPILTMCNDEQAKYEIIESKLQLENWLQMPVKYFAFPNGDYTERECQILKNAGYTMAFTTNPMYLEKLSTIDLFQIPRFGVVDNINFTENLCRMTGIWYERKKYNK